MVSFNSFNNETGVSETSAAQAVSNFVIKPNESIHIPIANFAVLVLVTVLICKYASVPQKLSKVKPWKKKTRIPYASLFFSFRIPFFDGLYNLIQLRNDGVQALEEMSKRFGYLYGVEIGPITTVAVANASVAQKVLFSSEPGHLNKPKSIYDRIFIDWFKDGLVNSDFGMWSPHRKMLSRCFTYKSLQRYLKIMKKHAKSLQENLDQYSVNDLPKNGTKIGENSEQIFDSIYCSGMKIIAQIIMGTDKLPEDTIAEFTRNFHAYKHLVLDRLMNPQLQFQPYWKFHPKKKEYDRLHFYMNNFLTNLMHKYRNENKDNEMRNEENNNFDIGVKPFRCVMQEMIACEATDKEIYDEVGTLLGTGHETTVVALQMLLLNLALNPEHQARCREEVDAFFKENLEDTENKEWEMSMDDLANLKYLERCILESGRITSTVPIFIRRLDCPLEIEKDLVLAAGSNVALLPWVLHRNPEYFPEPEKFEPDRFLPENVKQRHPYAYIPFSAGPRNCIGWKMAIMEMKVIMTWILQRFEVFTMDKVEDVKLLFEVTLLPERNYNIGLKRRNEIS